MPSAAESPRSAGTFVLLVEAVYRNMSGGATIPIMDTLPIEDLASQLDIPVATLRSYAQRFALFVPAVRTGAEIRYPPAGAALLAEIADAVRSGADFDEIELALQTHVPVTVVDDPRTARPIEELFRRLDELRQTTADRIAGLATAEQFHGLRAETASLAAALAQRDSHLEYTNALIVAELRVAFEALRQDIADLHAELHHEALLEDVAAAAETSDDAAAASHSDVLLSPPVAPSHRRASVRTPRRMGQPLRVNGAVLG